MNILLICHSVGDANIIIQTARKLSEKEAANIHLLVIGQAAKNRVEAEKFSKNIKVTYLNEILQKPFSDFDNRPLNEEEFSQVVDCLDSWKIDSALIGTPSLNDAGAPFQIAAYLAERLQHGLFYNDYLFYEEKHLYWKKIAEKGWTEKYRWLLPLPQAQKKFKEKNLDLKTEVVGHLALAAIRENKEDSNKLRSGLQDNSQNRLVFISGGKSVKEDLQLLSAITEALKEKRFSNIDVRIGLHPGLVSKDLNDYLTKMVQHLLQNPVKNSIQFIIDPSKRESILNQLTNPEISLDLNQTERFFRPVQIRGDQAAAAADGVACFVPATLVTQAAAQGKFAACYKGEPYLTAGITIGANMTGFFNQVSETKKSSKAGIPELALNPAQLMASMLTPS